MAILLGYQNSNFIGITDAKIGIVEQQYGIQFDTCMKAYFNIMGGRKPLLKAFLFEDIDYAYKILDKFKDLSKIEEQIKLISLVDENGLIQTNKEARFIFFQYDEIGSSYTFCFENIENPLLYLYWQGGEIEKYGTIISLLRKSLLIQFYAIANNRDYILTTTLRNNKHKIRKIPWFSFYEPLLESKSRWGDVYHVYSIRQEYDIERYNTRKVDYCLLGFDAYEVEFIKFLIEEKGAPYDVNKFDPYAPLITFEEYLN